jgi:hypothetical protein
MNDNLDMSLLTDDEQIQFMAPQLKAMGYDVQRLWACMMAVLGEHEPGHLTERQYTALAFERYHAEQAAGRAMTRRARELSKKTAANGY